MYPLLWPSNIEIRISNTPVIYMKKGTNRVRLDDLIQPLDQLGEHRTITWVGQPAIPHYGISGNVGDSSYLRFIAGCTAIVCIGDSFGGRAGRSDDDDDDDDDDMMMTTVMMMMTVVVVVATTTMMMMLLVVAVGMTMVMMTVIMMKMMVIVVVIMTATLTPGINPIQQSEEPPLL